MHVTTEATGLVRNLTVTLPASQVSQAFESKLKQVARTVKINGFRPGKVPLSRVRADYGASIQDDVLNDLMGKTLFAALQQENINAVGQPEVTEVKGELNGDFTYTFTVETYPEVNVQGLDKLEVERLTSTIADADVDSMIENLRRQRQTWVEKADAAANGDQVTFDFKGTMDGVAFEGGSAEDFKLVLGSGQMIPGFEDGLVGMKVGDEKTIDVTFPADYQQADLAGKPAQFALSLKKVEQAQLAEINDAFLSEFGVKEGGIDKLKLDVRTNMEREIRKASRLIGKKAVFKALLAHNDIDVPKALVKEEINRKREQLVAQFSQQFAGMGKIDASLFPDELFQKEAENTVKMGILVGQVIEDAALKVDADQVAAYIEDIAQSYEDPKEVIEFFSSNAKERQGIESVVLEDQAADYLMSKAKVTEKTVDYQALLAAQNAQDDLEDEDDVDTLDDPTAETVHALKDVTPTNADDTHNNA